jgi:hypothetical protein
MLEVVCSSGVVGRMAGGLPPNCEPKDKDGRSDRRGVGSLGLALMCEKLVEHKIGTWDQG